MKKIFEFIANILTIFIIGILLAKLRAAVKFYYFMLLGMMSICLGVGFGAIILAILGFQDVGGNMFSVLFRYSILFSLLAILFIFILDKIVVLIQKGILNFLESSNLSFFLVLFSFLSGAGMITFLIIIPDPVRSIFFFLFFFGTLFYGLRLKVGNKRIITNNQESIIPSESKRKLKIFGYDLRKSRARKLF